MDHRILYWYKFQTSKSVARSSTTGHGTNVIQGLAISMEATAMHIIVLGILFTNNMAGLYGIAIAVTSMLALTGMVVALVLMAQLQIMLVV